jgi:ribosomal protein S17E
MRLTSRFASSFIEIKVDEIETTIFKNNKQEVTDMLYNLLNIANDLAGYTDKSVSEHVADGGF